MAPEFHAELDIAVLRESYRIDKRTKIAKFLSDEAANTLSECVANDVDFGQAFFIDGASRQARRNELEALSNAQQMELRAQILDQAARGVGYWYGRHLATKESPAPVHAWLDWLNSENVLAAFRDITGIDGLRSASAQVTRFMPGDFLTRHNDVVDSEERRVAYAYNLSPSWHPDWGGLLMFFEAGGEPRDAWPPSFNTLNLFDVMHAHSVTSVSAFAPQGRYAISGWFKTK